VGAGLLVALAGCEAKEGQADLVNGKKLFVQRCGSCHVLERANTRGTQGPNLDEAFQRALRDGFGRDTVKNVTEKQILYPNLEGVMPAKLVEGQDAEDVAAYVAKVASAKGKDTGALATAVGSAQKALATARAGVLDIPADPNGQLLYVFKNAEAEPGPLTLNSRNPSSVPHNIAVSGGGIDEKGPVVQGGGVSTVKVDVKRGKYEFLCTVPGHAEGGMRGTLTVK
jgi:mono/diheme cytochrome c family protein